MVVTNAMHKHISSSTYLNNQSGDSNLPTKEGSLIWLNYDNFFFTLPLTNVDFHSILLDRHWLKTGSYLSTNKAKLLVTRFSILLLWKTQNQRKTVHPLLTDPIWISNNLVASIKHFFKEGETDNSFNHCKSWLLSYYVNYSSK